MTSTTSQMWGLDVGSGEIFEVRNMSSERSNFSSLAVGRAPQNVWRPLAALRSITAASEWLEVFSDAP